MSSHFVDLGIEIGGLAALGVPLTTWAARHAAKLAAHRTNEAISMAVDKLTTDIRSEMRGRFDSNDAKADKTIDAISDVDRRVIRIETQFGKNGGGLRETVDSVRVELGELRGEFRQHVAHDDR